MVFVRRTLPRRFPPPRWARGMYSRLITEITHIVNEAKESIVSNLDDSIQRNTQAVSDAVDAATEEITQLRDALAGTATPEQIAAIDSATQRLQDATTALQGDDTPPEAPAP